MKSQLLLLEHKWSLKFFLEDLESVTSVLNYTGVVIELWSLSSQKT